MHTLRGLFAAPLDPNMCEGTAAPWWFILDPKALTARAMSADDAINAVGMSVVTGPFFSREAATDFLNATRYNFGKDAVVWCASGCYSRGYKALLELAKIDADAEEMFAEATFRAAFGVIQHRVHENAVAKGWHKEDRNEGELIALEHAELSECLEALRHGNPPSEHIPAFTGAEEELADVIIRIMDHAAAKGHRVAEAIIAKMAFNATRPHRHGDKRF